MTTTGCNENFLLPDKSLLNVISIVYIVKSILKVNSIVHVVVFVIKVHTLFHVYC